MKLARFFFFCFFALFLPLSVLSQNQAAKSEAVSVFLDCNRCDERFIKQQITYINYVRDKEDSDVHILITRQRTGSGGTEFTIKMLGKARFEGINNTLKYFSAASNTDDEERRGLVKKLKVGLFPYVSKTEIVQDIEISYNGEKKDQSESQEDQWDSWIFEVSGDTYFNGEESRSNLFVSFGASADRVTPDWKINIDYDYDFNRRTFTELDSVGNESTTEFITRGQRFDGKIVKSLSDHWSVGIFGEAFTSSRNNIDFSASGSPAVEYNIFPYEEYSTHEISFMYIVKTGYFDYDEITIFNERSEILVRQQLRSRLEFTQPWGEIEGRINASTYMHDFSKNRVDVNLEFDFRIFRGLSLNLSGRYSLINDQLSIPKGNISDAEQLLDLRQQSTSYSYRGSVGIEYSFGSIYNNVVNPRF